MTAKMIVRWTLYLILSKTIASGIRNAQSSGIWTPPKMFLDWFGLHRSQREMLKPCQWRSMQSKRRGIMEWRKRRTECFNVAAASLCILTKSFCLRYIIGKWWAVCREYRLINGCIEGAMNLLTRYEKFSCVRANSARMLLRSALP